MGAFLVASDPVHLLITLIIVSLGYAVGPLSDFYFCIRLLLRLKWLFLSIFLIYVILTPGIPLLVATGAYITVEGVIQGLLRIGALVVLITAVNLLIRPSRQDELIFAIIWLLNPLRRFRFPVDRLAVRMVLTLNYVQEFQNLLAKENVAGSESSALAVNDRTSATKTVKWGIVQRLTALADKAVNTLMIVINRTSSATCVEILPPRQLLPHHHQWLYPLILGLIYTLT